MTILTKLRSDEKLTQEQLGELLDTTGSAVSNWETGRKKPSYKHLKKLSEIFNVPVDCFFKSNENE